MTSEDSQLLTFLSRSGPNDPYLAYLTFAILLWPPQIPLSLFHVICLAQGLAYMYTVISWPHKRFPESSSAYHLKAMFDKVYKTGLSLHLTSVLSLYCTRICQSVSQFSCSVVSNSLWPHESQHVLGYVGLPYAAVMLMSPRQRAGQESLQRKLERENQNVHLTVPILLDPF